MINVEFINEDRKKISSYFGSPQPEDENRFFGVVSSSDKSWHDFYSTFQQEVQNLLPPPE
ncbi:hypothetical protein [Yersinia enterocolitica]|uniref:hypothetical protein n=1 Tax=Yersinia enterocolitica TaxID=630 RepID=UPI000975A569|nr:hypothetical protein [Yersinia enterocolitica]